MIDAKAVCDRIVAAYDANTPVEAAVDIVQTSLPPMAVSMVKTMKLETILSLLSTFVPRGHRALDDDVKAYASKIVAGVKARLK